jgi:pilus assembly protein Flp/PilA
MRSLRTVLAPVQDSTDRERGQGLAEYALILALLAIVAIASLIFLGDSIVAMFEQIINEGFRYVQEVLAA